MRDTDHTSYHSLYKDYLAYKDYRARRAGVAVNVFRSLCNRSIP
jgi:hypothetical protein